MRKILNIILTVMLLFMIHPESLRADGGYTITIPSTINTNTNQTINYSVDDNYMLDVSVTSTNGNKVKNGSNAISYTPSATSWNELSGSGSFTYKATTSGTPSVAGTYTDTLTFNLHSEALAVPFYIEAVEATTITLSKKGSPTVGTAKYGINTTSPSTSYTYGNSISLTAGQKCYWTITSTTTAFSISKYLYFTSTGKIKAGGNLSSLIGGNTSVPRNYCFAYLFNGCTNLIDASDINFGSITSFNSKTYAFANMFQDCTSLTAAPELPATALANYCYDNMFRNCTGLTTAPKLPATTLAKYCYDFMFYGCTSLTTAPELPATTLVNYCYYAMFRNCTGLTTAPKLPATTLASDCYAYMFQDCTSLTTVPKLPATTLASDCYRSMFYGCTRLTSAPALPATTLASGCYAYMFYGCSKIKLSATRTGTYTKAYRIPTSGTGTDASSTMIYMFTNTGGTFTGAPTINTTYYLDSSNSVVQ